jgi:hypothetical protein
VDWTSGQWKLADYPFWDAHQENIGRKLMMEFTGLLAISSFTERLNVFLFQNRNQSLSNNRMISGERAQI